MIKLVEYGLRCYQESIQENVWLMLGIYREYRFIKSKERYSYTGKITNKPNFRNFQEIENKMLCLECLLVCIWVILDIGN